MTFIGLMIKDLTSEVTNVNEYKRMLSLESYEKALYQFPKEIPKEASNVQFFYRPQFLQGGMQMELKMTVDEETINSYINKYEESCERIMNTNEYESWEFSNVGIYNIGGHVNNENHEEDFTVYLIESKPYKEDNWNHGYVIFIAVNNAKNEIIFQSEVW